MTWDGHRKAQRTVLAWVLLQGYISMGVALISGGAFGLWQGSLAAGLWMALVLIGVPLSLGYACMLALMVSRELAAPRMKGDD
jgi:hypothetical protein